MALLLLRLVRCLYYLLVRYLGRWIPSSRSTACGLWSLVGAGGVLYYTDVSSPPLYRCTNREELGSLCVCFCG